jgi:hypothetical protein
MARESKQPTDRYARVARRMWNDETFREFSAPAPNAQTLWQFLLTTPDCGSIPGVFRFSVAATAERFGWSIEDTRRCLDEIVSKGCAEYDPQAQLIHLPNALRLNPAASPNVVRSWSKQWLELPECKLKDRVKRVYINTVTSLGPGFASAIQEILGKPFGKASPKDRESLPRTLPHTDRKSIPESGSGSGSGSGSPPKPPSGGQPLPGQETETETRPVRKPPTLIRRPW